MTVFVRAPFLRSILGLGILLHLTMHGIATAAPEQAEARQTAIEEENDSVAIETKAMSDGQRGVEPESEGPTPRPVLDVLEGIRSRQLTVSAEGTGDGRMVLSMTNRTKQNLRVVLPPGLIATGATGQFGGVGGRGGRGRRGGGMGMGGMGMGGMGMGGMGMGMGRMGMGGMGMGMGGGMGGGMMGGGTMPSTMGMMMVGRLIMTMVGDRDSWDQTSLMMGMMGGQGMGMGGMRMGGMSPGGMGMGMGMGGRGGGFRSVPAGPVPEAMLKPKETRHLPTLALSLDGPLEGSQVAVPAKGEKLRIGEVGQLKRGKRTEEALRQLAKEKAPEAVAQLVLWNVAGKVEWSGIRALSPSWANAAELNLARQFVARLDGARGVPVSTDSGHLFWDEGPRGSVGNSLSSALGRLLERHDVLGLTPQRGVPAVPAGPALACRFTIEASKVRFDLAKSHVSGRTWQSLGALSFPNRALDDDPGAVEEQAAALLDAFSAGLLSRVTRAELVKGPRSKGKPTYSVRIDNGSPLVLSGVAIAGPESSKPSPFAALAGVGISPAQSLRLPVSAEVVEQLDLKKDVRLVAADLGGL